MPQQDLKNELRKLELSSLRRSLYSIDSPQDPVFIYQGKQYLNFSSNNYLGLANHPRIKEALVKAVEQWGGGAGASRLVTGSMLPHHQLEFSLTEWKKTEAALIFNSGYHANVGVLSALMREGDVIFSDSLNHASIIDGCRLSRATVKVYPHLDLQVLEQHLSGLQPGRSSSSRWMIVTDSVFSMDGDFAPLSALAALAEKYDTWLFVDEAHATGIFGPEGRGIASETLFERNKFWNERLIQMGTFGKALGLFGAYVTGSQTLIDFLLNSSRPFIYTTALPPAWMMAVKEAILVLREEPDRRERLLRNIDYFRQKMGKTERCTPIFPIYIGDSQKALERADFLRESGVWVTPIRFPTVSKGTERLRVTLMSEHTIEMIDLLLQQLSSPI